MVFYIIACHKQGWSEQQTEQTIKNLMMQNQKSMGDISNIELDKSKFKIGTLDQLMELNESLIKVDLTLDSTVKKIEKQAKELQNQELFIEIGAQKYTVADYIKQFKWEESKYPRAKTMVELSGLIAEKMRTIDGDLKKQQDELNEVRNNLIQLQKGKEGNSFHTKDLGEVIYNSEKINAEQFFVERHGCENLCTLIAIVHKTKVQQFFDQYEKIVEMGAVPRSARDMDEEDKDGNRLIRFVVLQTKLENYQQESRKQGFAVKRFVYNYEQYVKDKEEITKLDNRQQFLKSQLSNKSYYAFSELFIALMHLKVIRTYIDAVLRFGIPPTFYIGMIKPAKGQDKKILQILSETFCDPAMKDMYGSKEDSNDTEDFWPFVLVYLTSPLFLQ